MVISAAFHPQSSPFRSRNICEEGQTCSDTDDPAQPQTKVWVHKVVDVTMTSPFTIDPDINETTEAIINLPERGVSHPAFWLHSTASLATKQLDRDVTLLDKLAPQADTVLAVLIWRSDGCPSYTLLLGWPHTRRAQKSVGAPSNSHPFEASCDVRYRPHFLYLNHRLLESCS